MTLLDGRVLLVGGHESRRSAVFDPETSTFAALPDMSTIHGFGLTATRLLDGRVLVLGGAEDFGGAPSNVAEVFDPTTDSWTTVGSMTSPRRNHAAHLLPSGRVYVAGGLTEDDFLDTAEVFDPATGLFSATPDLPEVIVGGSILYLSR